MSLIKGTREEQRLRLLERCKVAMQSAKDLRVDAIAEGDDETEWMMDAVIKHNESSIATLESAAPQRTKPITRQNEGG